MGPPFYRDGEYVQSMYGPAVDMWAIGCLMVRGHVWGTGETCGSSAASW